MNHRSEESVGGAFSPAVSRVPAPEGWAVERLIGSAAEFHARTSSGGEARRAVSFLTVDHPALVLGSTQPPATADRDRCAAAGVEVVRRRSGGGAVLLRPGETLWCDVVVPAGDPLWRDDVGVAFHWLGHLWADVLRSLHVDDVTWHAGPLVRGPWSDQVCFAGLGPGEVAVGGRKALGVAQRRTRDAARFQCALLLGEWDPGPLVDLLALSPAVRRHALEDLGDVAVGVAVAPGEVEQAFVAHLTDR